MKAELMKKIIEKIKYWGQLLLLPLYGLSFLVPRDKRIWLFGSTFGKRFADNPRYLYLYISQRVERGNEAGCQEGKTRNSGEKPCCIDGKPIRPIWISHDPEIVEFLNENGYEAYMWHSLKGIWYALRGKVYLFDNYSKDINFWLSGGAVKVNLWHGVGNKCINYDNRYDKARHPQNVWDRLKYFPRRLSDEKPSHYILTTSPMMSKIFERAFRVSESHVIEAGYPRNDILLTGSETIDQTSDQGKDAGQNGLLHKTGGNILQNLYLPKEQEIQINIRQWRQEKKIILGYLPTFRPSEAQFAKVCDLAELNEFLQENNMVLVCKPHPKSVCRKVFEQMCYSNTYYVSPEVDVNSFLGQIDLLIADYSSVYSDFMLLNRPVVAFHYDYEEYTKHTRDGYFDFEEYMPEVRAYDLQGLKDGIQKVLQEDRARERRNAFRAKLFENMDDRASERLTGRVMDILEGYLT